MVMTLKISWALKPMADGLRMPGMKATSAMSTAMALPI
jgi:hypothetical protein